jgi:hypothetical protein
MSLFSDGFLRHRAAGRHLSDFLRHLTSRKRLWRFEA